MQRNPFISLLIIFFILIFSSSCKEKTISDILNEGEILLENGMGELEKVKIECHGCNVLTLEEFHIITEGINENTKNLMKSKRSYIPLELFLLIEEEKSLTIREHETVHVIISKIDYVAKNSYGGELDSRLAKKYCYVNGLFMEYEIGALYDKLLEDRKKKP